MTTRILFGLMVSILPVFAQDSNTEPSAVDIVNEARVGTYQLTPGVRKGVLIASEHVFVLDTPEGILVRPPLADGTADIHDATPNSVTPAFQFTVHMDGTPEANTVTFLQVNTPDVPVGTRILLNTPEEGTPIFMVQERPRVTEFSDDTTLPPAPVYTTEPPIVYESPVQTTIIIDPFYPYYDYGYRYPRYYRPERWRYHPSERHIERPLVHPPHYTQPRVTPHHIEHPTPHRIDPPVRHRPETHNNHNNPPPRNEGHGNTNDRRGSQPHREGPPSGSERHSRR